MAGTEVNSKWPAFPTRLMALPTVSGACDIAIHLYSKSKECQIVGLALDLAEGTLKSAVTVATPLATPLLGYVEHLKPLDDWACRRLDDVERMVPAITKPTGEMLNAAKHGVLVRVAGEEEPPPTFTAAFSTRAARLATTVKEQATAVSISVPHRMLDSAHSFLDHYLPEERSTEQRPVKLEDGLAGKTVALATKTSHCLCLAAHNRFHASCPLDPTPSHLAMECMQSIRRRCPEGLARVGQQQQQSVLMVLVFVLPVRLTLAAIRILLTSITILAEELIATRMKMMDCGRAAVKPKNGQRVHAE